MVTLEHRTGPDGDDSGRQYSRAADDDRTYRLKTNEDDHDARTYDDLAQFIRTINGAGLGGGEGRFDTDAFRESVRHHERVPSSDGPPSTCCSAAGTTTTNPVQLLPV